MSASAAAPADGDSLRVIRRIFGPPGTGKTTELARRVGITVEQRGGDAIRIGSFSRTAAAEIASRDEIRNALPRDAVGTMHHHAYAAIEHPPIALDPEVLPGWNESVSPTWRITGTAKGGAGARAFESRERVGGGASQLMTGDDLLEQLGMLRSMKVPPGMWPGPVRTFARRWTDWKRDAGVVDFEDMIVRAAVRARDGEPMPGTPEVIVIDEAQDMTPSEVELALLWGRRLDPEHGRLIFALDDDQAIMEWRGGDPRRIIGLNLPSEEQSQVLQRSHRVPPAVHAAADSWIRHCGTRFPKDYYPRGETEHDATPTHARGWCQRAGYGLSSAELVDQIEQDLADPDLRESPAAAVMVIASCGYMLVPLIQNLRRRGIPFHNPFRADEQAWNPLGKPGRGKSTAERIYRFAVVNGADLGEHARRWTGEDIRMWTEMVNVREAQFAHKVRTHKIPALPDGEVPGALLLDLFRDSDEGNEALRRATRGDLDWLASVITDTRRARVAAFPLEVAKLRGARALAVPPRVVVGTIHSTKGAQASRVYLAPDLSAAGRNQWNDTVRGRDQAIRLMYVGMTRAYHGLTVLAPDGGYSISPAELVPSHLEVRR